MPSTKRTFHESFIMPYVKIWAHPTTKIMLAPNMIQAPRFIPVVEMFMALMNTFMISPTMMRNVAFLNPFQNIPFVEQAQIALSAFEEDRKHFLEMLPDGLEGFLKLLHGTAVDFRDRLLRVGDGFFDIQALAVQKLVSLLQFLVFLECAHVDGAEVFDQGAQPVAGVSHVLVGPLPFGVLDIDNELLN